MLNLIRMDLYRMFKMKSFYVILIIMALSVGFTTIVMKQTVKMVQDNPELEEMMEVEDEQSIGITVSMSDEGALTADMLLVSNIKGMTVALLLLIFVVLFSTSDFTSGFIKNIGGQTKSRLMLVGSKSVAVVFYTVFNFAATIVFQLISNLLFTGGVEFLHFGKSLKFIGVELVLHIALSLAVMMVALLIRSNLMTMIIAVLSTMGFPSLIYTALKKLIPGHPDISEYMVTPNIMGLQPDDYQRVLLISLAFFVVAILVSAVSYKKRDFA